MADDKPPQITLTIFLIKKDKDDIDSFLPDNESLDSYTIQNGSDTIGYLFVKLPRSKPPGWGKFFKNYINAKDLGKASSTGGVFVVRASERWFAITFGQIGRYLLEPECWEERFGLLVSLNSIGQEQIKSIDKLTFDALATHSRVQTSQEAAWQEFGLDVEQDLVRAVTGTPSDPELGHRLTGMDALRVSANITIEQLPGLLMQYQSQFNAKTYKKHFPWVDQIAEVKGRYLKEELDSVLVEHIRAQNFERCWMAVPHMEEWSRIDGFRYGSGKRHPMHHDTHLPEFLEEVRDPANVTIERLRQRQVYCFGDDDQQINQWSVYRCIYCELDHGGSSYLLSDGKWYCVTRDFVQEVDEHFSQIERYSKEFPEYDDDSEGAYNERVAAGVQNSCVLMDKKLIAFGGGYNKFEFCDLYTLEKEIIHVKRYGQSSAFSHLFAQGTNSGELFHTQPEFRELVNQKLPASHRLNDSNKRPEPGEYQVVFAIVSDVEGPDLMIPFFSRLNLRSAVRRLEGYGYRVAIAKIPVNPARSKRKRYDPE
ncbi:MAG: TIGR04141 family sporadically distributed protein [Candidatus Thiodiazotropha endolucinida]